MACSSPQFSERATSCSQLAKGSSLHSSAPMSKTFWQLNLEGPSERFESVGILAYQGVSCFVHSSAIVATKIFFAVTFIEMQEVRESRTPLLSV